MKNLQGKNVLITGAAGGIGSITAHFLAREGCNLILTDINADGLNRIKPEFDTYPIKVSTIKADVTSEEDWDRIKLDVEKDFGHLDVLISNAAIAVAGRTYEIPVDDWKNVINVNLWGTILGVKTFVPDMIQRQSGHIVAISSGLGLTALPYINTYVTTKFALVGYTESLRIELRQYGVGVTTACPGVVDTKIFDTTKYHNISPEIKNALLSLGKVTPEYIAKRIVPAIKKNKGLLPLTAQTKIFFIIKRISQNIFEFLSGRMIKKVNEFK